MLILNPGLMANMDDGHLLRSLECEAAIMRTPVEMELMRRLDELVGKETPEEVESRLEKTYESALEQSEFRAQLIKEIIELCDRPGSKKDLVSAIKMALENSYVEL